MGMGLEEVKKIFTKTAEKAGCAIVCPITFNGRFKNVTGRVSYTSNGRLPSKVEFSKRYFESESYEKCVQVIKHECAHYIVIMRTHESHNHDEVFRAVCKEIGCTLTGEYAEIETPSDAIVSYKWEIRCSKCGKIIRKYKRLPAKFNNLNGFTSCCCNAPVKLKELRWCTFI